MIDSCIVTSELTSSGLMEVKGNISISLFIEIQDFAIYLLFGLVNFDFEVQSQSF